MPEETDTPSTLRLFVAINLPDEWREALRRVQERERRAAGVGLRWVDPGLLHLTVVFLGHQPAERLPAIEEALERATTSQWPVPLRLGALGCFGPRRAPRVVWCGVEAPPGRLEALRRALDEALDAAELEYDRKPLVPHVTLARAGRGRVGQPPPLTQAPRPLPTEVGSIELMESRLSPSGPTYLVVRSFPLGSPP